MLNFFVFLKFFVAETKKETKKNKQTKKTKSNQFDLFFLFQQQKSYVVSEKTWKNLRVHALWVDFLKCFLLSNQIHRKFKTNQNILTFYNKMVDSANVQPKQKLPDEENQLLSTYIFSHVGILLL